MKIHIKVWTSDLRECETFVFPSSAQQEDAMVVRFAAAISQKFPNTTLKVVGVGAHRYNLFPVPTANA